MFKSLAKSLPLMLLIAAPFMLIAQPSAVRAITHQVETKNNTSDVYVRYFVHTAAMATSSCIAPGGSRTDHSILKPAKIDFKFYRLHDWCVKDAQAFGKQTRNYPGSNVTYTVTGSLHGVHISP